MKRVPVLLGSLTALLATAPAGAQSQPSEVDIHVANARAAAGQDFRNTFINLCIPNTPRPGGGGGFGGGAPGGAGGPGGAPGGAGGPGGAPGGPGAAPRPAGGGGGGGGGGASPDRAGWYAPPYKVFDNLYWLGSRTFSSWALTTSAGIIIIDTNFAYTTQAEIIDGLTTLGLNPNDIEYVIISHAHGDHDQGAAELQRRFGAKVVMGEPDWVSTLARPATAAGGVPTKDVSVGPNGYKLTLGDVTVDIIATPGHTDGTLSYVFPVKNGGETVMVAYSGGTLTGAFGTNASRWDQYIDSQRRIAAAAAAANASVILSNHSEYDGAYTRARLLLAPRAPGENHPFIVGPDRVQGYFTVMQECATASKLRNNAQ